MQVGLGVTTGSISPVFSQGAIENTREATNVAIQGNGLFVVRGDAGNAYTRAGNFSFNADGKLVTPDGYFVQGYTATDPVTGAIVTTGTPTDIAVPPGVLRAPAATNTFSTLTNLDAGAATGTTFTTSVRIYDALGESHVATLTYTKQAAAGAWNYTVTVPGDEIQGGTAGTPFQVGTGSVGFDANGKLTTVNGAAPADVVINTPAWTNGAAPSAWTWDIMDANNQPSLTGFASPSATSSISQNGSAAGMIDNISITGDGTILATFGAGQTVAVGQLALASFNNPKGLVKMGSNRYGESQAAGIPNVGVAGTGGRGTLIGSALEQSNVDIATEFTQMILAQRGYQANSKTITVSDEILVDTLALKR
jgi:flagellar hook protein FlgE